MFLHLCHRDQHGSNENDDVSGHDVMVQSTASRHSVSMSFRPVLHDWCKKCRGMCYPVCGMVHIKDPLLLIKKSSPCGSSRFPLSLSEWSFTICLMPYNRE